MSSHSLPLFKRAAPHSTTVDVCGVPVGGAEVFVVAGPCAVESEAQLRAVAAAVKAHGASAMRGGTWKPRTSPYAFKGLGLEGLRMLRAIGDEFELPVITEVLSERDVEAASALTHVVQIGARNMQNFALLDEVGRIKTPVLLKRGMSATLEEFALAAERVMARGNTNVILCERGIRTFEHAMRNTFDVAAIAWLKRETHLPVMADPSHATGDRSLVVPVALSAIAAGADGLLIEVHNDPDHALSDGPQSLTPEQFGECMRRVRPVALAVGRGCA